MSPFVGNQNEGNEYTIIKNRKHFPSTNPPPPTRHCQLSNMIGRFYFFLSCLPFTLRNSTLYISSPHAHTFCNNNHIFFLCIITVCEECYHAGPSTHFVVLISLAPRVGLLAVTGALPRCPNCKLGHPNGHATDQYLDLRDCSTVEISTTKSLQL
jgi:hypothetical protein